MGMKTNPWITLFVVALLLPLPTVTQSQTPLKPCGLTISTKKCTNCLTETDRFLLNFNFRPQLAKSESLPVNRLKSNLFTLSLNERNHGNGAPPCHENQFTSALREEHKFS